MNCRLPKPLSLTITALYENKNLYQILGTNLGYKEKRKRLPPFLNCQHRHNPKVVKKEKIMATHTRSFATTLLLGIASFIILPPHPALAGSKAQINPD